MEKYIEMFNVTWSNSYYIRTHTHTHHHGMSTEHGIKKVPSRAPGSHARGTLRARRALDRD